MRSLPSFAAAIMLLVACGSPSPVPAPGAFDRANAVATAKGQQATLTIQLPPIQATPAPRDERSPDVLAPATGALFGKIGRINFEVSLDDPSKVSCAATSAGKSCTITLKHAPVGTFPVQLWTNAPGNDAALATASGSVTIAYGVVNRMPALRWFGVAHSLSVVSNPGVLIAGSKGTSKLHVYGVDITGTIIPSSDVIDPQGNVVRNIEMTAAGPYPASSLKPAARIARPAGHVTFEYDGFSTGVEEFSATPKSGIVQASTACVSLLAPNAARRYLIVNRGEDALVFDSTQCGDAHPLSTISNAGGDVYGADAEGNFWAGNRHYSANGTLLGTFAPKAHPNYSFIAVDGKQNVYTLAAEGGSYPEDCQSSADVYVYKAGSYGAKLVNGYSVMVHDGSSCVVQSMTVDPNGVVYVAWRGKFVSDSNYFEATFYRFGLGFPKAVGSVCCYDDEIDRIQASSDLHLFGIYQQGQLAQLDGSFRVVYPSLFISAFALDSQNDRYVVSFPSYSGGRPVAGTVLGFAPGKSKPFLTIGGPTTRIPGGDFQTSLTVTP